METIIFALLLISGSCLVGFFIGAIILFIRMRRKTTLMREDKCEAQLVTSVGKNIINSRKETYILIDEGVYAEPSTCMPLGNEDDCGSNALNSSSSNSSNSSLFSSNTSSTTYFIQSAEDYCETDPTDLKIVIHGELQSQSEHIENLLITTPFNNSVDECPTSEDMYESHIASSRVKNIINNKNETYIEDAKGSYMDHIIASTPPRGNASFYSSRDSYNSSISSFYSSSSNDFIKHSEHETPHLQGVHPNSNEEECEARIILSPGTNNCNTRNHSLIQYDSAPSVASTPIKKKGNYGSNALKSLSSNHLNLNSSFKFMETESRYEKDNQKKVSPIKLHFDPEETENCLQTAPLNPSGNTFCEAIQDVSFKFIQQELSESTVDIEIGNRKTQIEQDNKTDNFSSSTRIERPISIYYCYDVANESRIRNNSINERNPQANCYGQLFRNYHMPVPFFVSLFMNKYATHR